jgi:hypothetical protein
MVYKENVTLLMYKKKSTSFPLSPSSVEYSKIFSTEIQKPNISLLLCDTLDDMKNHLKQLETLDVLLIERVSNNGNLFLKIDFRSKVVDFFQEINIEEEEKNNFLKLLGKEFSIQER